MFDKCALVLVIAVVGQAAEVPQNSRLAKVCPVIDGYWTTFLRNVYDCNSYYKCSNGKAIPQRCPPGLFFHPRLLVCDFPLRTGCCIIPHPPNEDVVSEDQSTLDTPMALFKEAPIEEAEEIIHDGPHLAWWCPKVDGRWPTYLIDRSDCRRYYECSNGKPVLQRCPTGTFFNSDELTCDRKESVRCWVVG